MEIQLKQNFARIIRTLEGQGIKTTKIAHLIGFTTTTQLANTLEGTSLLSTKAIIGMIENLKVNPTYLFLGKGEMFLSEEDEIEKLQKENRNLIHNHNEVVKTVLALNDIIKKLEKKNDDLMELSNTSIEYYKMKIKELQPEIAESEESIKRSNIDLTA